MKRWYFISIFVLAILAMFVTCGDRDTGGDNNPSTYTITFHKNYDSEDPIHSVITVARAAMVENVKDKWPSDPTRADHIFVEWSTHPNGGEFGEKFHAAYPLTDHITVYAQWRVKESVTVKLDILGNESDDSITLSSGSLQDQVEIQDVEEGETITLSYTLATSQYNINRLAFSGVTNAIEPVTSAGSGTREYTVNVNDVKDGIITIKATFIHTNKQYDETFSFDEDEIDTNKTYEYGLPPFSAAISKQGGGTGKITYSSSDPEVASVDPDTGEVTIHKAGSTIITAAKEEDETYAEVSASFPLHIAARQLIISAPTVNPKPYDGNTTANVTIGSLTNKVGEDDVTVSLASAVYNSANAAEANKVTITYAISGAQAGSYITPVVSEVKGTISKAPGALLSGSIAADGEPTETGIKIKAVTAPNNGQAVEYAVSTQNQLPVNGWQGGVTFSGLTSGTTYYIFARAKANDNYNAGTQISGHIKTKDTYTVSFNITGNQNGDAVTLSSGSSQNNVEQITGAKIGDTITISYTLAASEFANNRLVFSGIANNIAPVTAPGTGTRTYIVNSGDATIGTTIIINAAFTHTDKMFDTMAFSGSGNTEEKTYGDAKFIRAAATGSGAGTITYVSNNTSVATVNSSTGEVTILKVGNAEITATRAEDADYAEATASYILEVGKLQLTISAPTVTRTKTYDGNTTAAVTNAGTLTNKVGSDSVSPSAVAAFNSANAADANKITVTYSIVGAQADNYIEPVDYVIDSGVSITQKQLTISGTTAASMVYNGSTNAVAAITNVGTLGGKIGNDDVTAAVASAAYNSASVGTTKTITVVYSISGAQAGNYIKPVNSTITNRSITALKLTISAPTGTTTKTYDGNTTATGITAGSLTNKVGSDAVTVSVASAAYNSADAGTDKTITVTYNNPSGAQAGNYTKPDNSTISGSITKATGAALSSDSSIEADGETTETSITIKAVTAPSNGQTVEYAVSTTQTPPSSGWQDGLTFSGLTSGTTYYVFARVKANNNYNAGTPISVQIKTKDTYTVSLNITGNEGTDTVTIKLGNNAPGNSIAGVKAGDTITISYTLANTKDKNKLDFSGTASAITSVTTTGNGTRSYTAAGADSVEGTITITAAFEHANKVVDPIAFSGSGNTVKTYGDAKFTRAASTDSGTGTITYTSSAPSVATVNSSTGEVTILKAGESVITATRAEDADYKVNTASYTLEVEKRQLIISGTNVTKTKAYNGNTTAAVVSAGTLTNKVGSDTVNVSAAAVYNSANAAEANKITVTFSISGAQADNYIKPADTDITDGVSITAKQLTVSGTTVTKTKTYNRNTTAAVTANGTLNGVLNGDNVSFGTPTAAYDNANAGTGKTITVTYSISGTNAGNYTKPVDATFNDGVINALQLTVSGTTVTKTKTYNKSTTAAVTANGTLNGVINGDSVTFGVPTAAYDDANVGTGKTITVTYSISGSSIGNYIKPVDAAFTDGVINAVQLTIANPTLTKTKEYDKNTTAAVTPGTLNGRLTGDTVTVTAAATYNNANIGTGKTITVVYTLGGANAGNYVKPVDYTASDGVITTKQLTIANPTLTTSKEYDKGTSAAVTAGALSGVLTNDTVNVSATATYNNANIGTGKTITVVYTISGTNAGNYVKPVDYQVTTGVITTKQLTIANPTLTTTKEYDKNTTAAVTVGALSGILTNDTVTVTAVAAYNNANIGTGKTITVVYTLGGANAGNYAKPADYTVSNGVITTKQLTIANPTLTKTKEYDKGTTAVVTVGALSGILTGDTVTVTAAAAYDNANMGTGKTITVVYTLGGANAGNYVKPVNFTASDGVITAKQLTVSGTTVTKTKTYNRSTTAAVTANGSLAGILQGDTVTLGTPTATYDNANAGTGKTITVTYSISGANASNYAKPVDVTYTDGVINAVQLTVSGTTVTKTKTYNRNTTAAVTANGTLAGVLTNDTVTLGTPTAAYDNMNVGTGKTITVTYSISGANAGNYIKPVDATHTDGVINAVQLTVSGTTVMKTKTYNRNTTAAVTANGTLAGVLQSDTVTLNGTPTATYDNANVGTGKTITVVYSITGANAGNYIKPVNATFNDGVINAVSLTIAAPTITKSKEYDKTTTAAVTAGSLSGILTNDTVTVTAAGTYNSAAVGTGKTITVVYTLGGTSAGNYTAPANSTANDGIITAKQLTISGTTVTKSKTYNGNTNVAVTANGTLAGILSGETVTLGTPTAAYDTANVGTGKTITVVYSISGTNAGNYTKPVDTKFTDGAITAIQLTMSNPTVTTSKAYDRTDTAAVTAGTMSGKLTADTVTVSAAATYNNANVGTAKTITVVYTIAGAQAGNYTKPANYTVSTGVITAKALTIANPTLTTSKTYNGNTTATVSAGALSGIITGDTVTVSAAANYASADVGTGKTITVVYTLGGAQADNYTKPANYTVNNGVITKASGQTVSAPTVSGTPTTTGITVNAVSAPSGQTVEYAIGTSTTAPSNGWQSGTSFTGLTANTNYYVFARSASNTNYDAGTAARSAQIKTATGGSGGNPTVPPVKVDFEADALNKTYSSTQGDNSPTVQVVADPASSNQKSLRIVSGGSGSTASYNQAAIIPITLPYSLENWATITFRIYLGSGTADTTVHVYAASATSAFKKWGFGNHASGSNNFPELEVGDVTISATTGSWQNCTLNITNPGASIKNLRNTVYLAIGINNGSQITYYLDDITLNIVSGFTPPPAPVTPNPPSTGAVTSGTYRNLFKEWGKTDAQIDAKVNDEWNKKFVNGTTDEMLFVQASDSSMAYIYTADTDDVRSEGMSYGMMMCVQMNDQTRFNKLWKWAHTYMYHDRTVNNTGKNVRGFFSWQCRTNGTAIDTGPAPDGEFYFVTALLFAENRWGNGNGINNYGQYARYIMYDMLHREPGVKDNYGAIPMINATHKIPEFTTVTAQHTDASYMLPAFYDVWAMEIRAGTSYHNSIWGSTSAANADATYWEEVATACRNYLKNSGVLNSTTGLGPDYSSYTGSPGSHGDFEYDAWRIAMNIGMDYAWFAKDTWQKTQSDRIQTFFQGEGVTSYGNRYTLSGNKLGSDHSPGLVACNAVASLAATNIRAWEFVENLWDIPVTTGKYRYYDGCLYMMGLLHVSGKFKAYLSTGGGSTNPYISPTSATFNKYTSSADYKDIAVTMTLNGSSLSNIKNGNTTLTQGNNVYTVSGSTVTIKTAYLAQQSVGTTTLTFTFANGTTRTISIDIVNTAPTPTITPTTATFDKKTSAQADVVVTMTLNGSTLSSIKNGSTTLTQGNSVYTVSGSTVNIKAAYLAGRANGNTTLTFTFSDGTTRDIVITVGDTTNGGTIGGGTEYNFATATPTISTVGSGITASITNGLLTVNRTAGYGSPTGVVIQFSFTDNISTYSKVEVKLKGSGDLTYKTMLVEISTSTPAAAGSNTTFGSVSTGGLGASFTTLTANRSGSPSATGQVYVIISFGSTNPSVHEIESIRFVK